MLENKYRYGEKHQALIIKEYSEMNAFQRLDIFYDKDQLFIHCSSSLIGNQHIHRS